MREMKVQQEVVNEKSCCRNERKNPEDFGNPLFFGWFIINSHFFF